MGSEKDKRLTDPQQNEIDGNVLGKPFEAYVGDTKGRQDGKDEDGASQTGGVDEQDEKQERP